LAVAPEKEARSDVGGAAWGEVEKMLTSGASGAGIAAGEPARARGEAKSEAGNDCLAPAVAVAGGPLGEARAGEKIELKAFLTGEKIECVAAAGGTAAGASFAIGSDSAGVSSSAAGAGAGWPKMSPLTRGAASGARRLAGLLPESEFPAPADSTSSSSSSAGRFLPPGLAASDARDRGC
jgi:hypothetical protein